jgi:putative transposase
MVGVIWGMHLYAQSNNLRRIRIAQCDYPKYNEDMGNEYVQRRNSLRLDGYDYSQEGAYFITLITADRQKILGDIQNDTMRPSLAGSVIISEWQKIPDRFPSVKLDAYTVMPNHLHGIIVLQDNQNVEIIGSNSTVKCNSTLSTIIGSFKSATSRGINKYHFLGINDIWHRGFHDHIIRNVTEYDRISEYILNNPAHWSNDEYW